jgi:dihydrolipoamide dehydrogenase
MTKKYDVAVLGGGPGGYVAAIRLAKLGKKAVLIEKDNVGGTCLNRGCIPTKALLHSAEVYEQALHAADYGVSVEGASYDYTKIAGKKDEVVGKLRGGIEFLLKKAGVDVIKGTGVVEAKGKITVDGKESVEADDIIIATGSKPSKVPIPGIDSEGVVDSDGVLAFTQAPESLVIIGGGVIGIEFASLFNALGKKVTVIEMLPKILGNVDDDITQRTHTLLKKQGIDIFTSAKVTKIEKGVTVYFEMDGETKSVKAQTCVVAIGRSPVTSEIGLEALGLKMNRGFVEVDERMKTNVDGIYAIGDITGKAQLAHVASEQGLVAAHNIAGQDKRMRYDVIPACIYTRPEIASVGITEAAAKEKGINVKTGSFLPAANGKSMIAGEQSGIVKVVTDADTGEILGAHLMCHRATDMIAEVCAAMRAEGTIEELSDTVHPHPTVSEMIMEAAHDVHAMCVHKVYINVLLPGCSASGQL